MRDLNDLYYFVQVVDHGGFAPAGRALGIPKSKLSRRIAALEDDLGVRLIHRTTRCVSVTDLGRAYYHRCVAMLAEADAAQDIVENALDEPQGLVRLSCPPGMLHFRIASLLAQFMAGCPRVRIELLATSRRVDLVREGFDLALRVRFPPLEDSDMNMRTLCASPQRLVASPALFSEQAAPEVPEALQHWPTCDMEWPTTIHAWHLHNPNGASVQVTHHPRLVTDDLSTLRQATLNAVGIAQLPLMVCEQDITAGRLVTLLPDWTPKDGVFHAVFPSRRGLAPSVRAVIDYLADHLGSVDFLPSG